MDEFERHERKREAWMRLRAQRRRAGELRGRVVAVAVVCFALLWAVVFAQMVSGNDPVLSVKATARSSSRAKEKKRLLAEARSSRRAEEEAGEVEFLPLEESELLEPEVVEPEVIEPEGELESLTTGQS